MIAVHVAIRFRTWADCLVLDIVG